MKAIRVYKDAGPDRLVYEDVPQPQPEHGEVLVRVYATGVTPTEINWRTTWKTKIGTERQRPIPGHEFSGIVVQIGAGVSEIKVGQPVFGLTAFDRDGSQAEYTIALLSELAPKPQSLDHIQAAAVPLAAQAAWQALFDHAQLSAGQTVLIHGAAGGVGCFAVQLARWAELRVIGVDGPAKQGFLRDLGCDDVIDYTTTPFEGAVSNVDAVLDAAGVGGVLDRSWPVLKRGGTLISLAQTPSQEQARKYGVKAIFFVVEPKQDELLRIGELLAANRLRPVIGRVFPLSQASRAYQRQPGDHTRGKIVLRVVAQPPQR
jgi:NADPH:quinone reductase-like Zn-dependent oxidoreductase